MFIDNEIELEQTCKAAELNEFRETPNSGEIKRTINGSIDTEYYLEQSNKARSKCFIQLMKTLFGRAS